MSQLWYVCTLSRTDHCFYFSSIQYLKFNIQYFMFNIQRYVRLNRDRLKGSSGEAEALLGLNVLFEVLLTMSQIMSPFTPFFAEYLYQNLRKLQPLYENKDESVPIDSSGNSLLKLFDIRLIGSNHYCNFIFFR
jgi:isoleucyl-tRNA synthetase